MMINKVNFYFNHEDVWELVPKLSYSKRHNVHVLSRYEIDHLSNIDLCREF